VNQLTIGSSWAFYCPAQEESSPRALSLARILLGKPLLVLLGDGLFFLITTPATSLPRTLQRPGATILCHPVLAHSDIAAALAA
jgi:hypothetical protein